MQTDERAEGTLASETLGTGELLLCALTELGRITAGDLDSAATLDAFSAAVEPLVPHELVNMAYLEPDGQHFHLLGGFDDDLRHTMPAHYVGSVATDGSPYRHTLRTGEPRVIADYPNEPQFAQSEPRVRAVVEALGLRSGLSVPLRVRGQVIGVLMFASRTPGRYDAEHVTVAQRIADHLAPFVENLRLYAIERRQRAHIAALNAVGQTIAASLEVEDVFPVFAAAARELVEHDRVGVALVSEDGQALEQLAFAAHDAEQVSWGERVDLADTTLRAVIEQETPLWSADILHDPRVKLPHDREATRKEGLAGLICVPLRSKGRAFGILTFGCVAAGQFGEADVLAAQQIADQIAPFLDNVRLYRQVRALGAAEERNRLAREVHDTLAQSLTAIALQLDTAELLLPADAKAAPLVAQARDLTRRALEEARRAVWGLQPTPLEDRTLGEALAAELVAFERRSGVKASFQTDGEPQALDLERCTALFRITQEALHNVEKHAGAHRVRVDLEFGRPAETVTLQVIDDGHGFEPATARPTVRGGFGLQGMRERARLIGGTLEVESVPGVGTRLIVTVPIHGAAAAPQAPDSETVRGTAAPIRVMLLDDHPQARAVLRRLLAEEPTVIVVGEATDGPNAVERVATLQPDVILMDLQVSRRSGVWVVSALRERCPSARVLVVTAFAPDDELFEALKAGASGYLLKDASRDELLHGIRAVYQADAAARGGNLAV